MAVMMIMVMVVVVMMMMATATLRRTRDALRRSRRGFDEAD